MSSRASLHAQIATALKNEQASDHLKNLFGKLLSSTSSDSPKLNSIPNITEFSSLMAEVDDETKQAHSLSKINNHDISLQEILCFSLYL